MAHRARGPVGQAGVALVTSRIRSCMAGVWSWRESVDVLAGCMDTVAGADFGWMVSGDSNLSPGRRLAFEALGNSGK